MLGAFMNNTDRPKIPHRPNSNLQHELQHITQTVENIRLPYANTEEIERAIIIINEKLSNILNNSKSYLHGTDMIMIRNMIDVIFIRIITFGFSDGSGNEYTRNAIEAIFTLKYNLKMLLNKMGQDEHYELHRADYVLLGNNYLMNLHNRNTQIPVMWVTFMRSDETPADEEAEENQYTDYASSENMFKDNMSEDTY